MWQAKTKGHLGSAFEPERIRLVAHEKGHPRVAFQSARKRITCWQRQKQEQRVPMRQQQVQKQLQQVQQVQQGLLFYRRQREQQQPKGSPAGAFYSYQFSFDGDENNF